MYWEVQLVVEATCVRHGLARISYCWGVGVRPVYALLGPQKTSQPVWGSAGVLLSICGKPVCLQGLSGAAYVGDVLIQQDE